MEMAVALDVNLNQDGLNSMMFLQDFTHSNPNMEMDCGYNLKGVMLEHP